MADPGSSPAGPSRRTGGLRTKSGSYREVTLAAVVFGLLTGVVINAAIAYAGLKIGFTIVGSAIIAVLGFGVLRGILRRGSIVEVNIAQTVGSAVDTTNSGVIFTVPVLFLLGLGSTLTWTHMDFWLLTLACSAGGVLGVAFIIPLRKQMIDVERLRFPSGTAVATILKSPGAGAMKAVVLLLGILGAMAIYLPASLPQIKVSAGLDRLDALVASGVISQSDADRTRLLDQWARAEAAPDYVLERGRLAGAVVEAREAAAAHPSDEALQTAVANADAALAATSPGAGTNITDDAALAAFQASAGERTWASLRGDADAGWAQRPLWGYSNLDIRLPARAGADGAPRADKDHDGDGRPDLAVTNDTVDVGRLLGVPSDIALIFAIAPFAIGAGYLSGRAGLFVLAGTVLAYHLINPVLFRSGMLPATWQPQDVANGARALFNRPLGIGMLLGGALTGLLFALPAIREAMKSLAGAGKSRGARDELGIGTLVICALLAIALLYLAADFIHAGGDSAGGLLGGMPSHVRYLLIAIISAAWIWFAGIIIAQCTGMTDWSPISGMALITVVLIMTLAGTDDVKGAVLIGASLCVAITLAADMMQDLKTGYLVGAVPRKQQMVELAAAGFGPLISMATVVIIAQANMEKYGVPIGEGTDTTAPQAQALKVVIEGVQGGELPYALYGFGAVLGVLLGFAAFPSHGVLVGLSMYLPAEYLMTYGIGCILSIVVEKIRGKNWSEEWMVPLAAGLIVGEAILSLLINGVILIRSAT